MELILDKGFLESFLSHNAQDKSLYDDFTRFLQRLQPGFTLVTNYRSWEDLEKAALENELLMVLLERVPSPAYVPDLEKKLEEKDFYEQGNALKLFLVESTPGNCDNNERKFGYVFFCGANLGKKWKVYSPDFVEESRPICTNPAIPDAIRFDKWEKLKQFAHPINSIILADKYILSDKSSQKIDFNLKQLLLQLIPDRTGELLIELLIIAEELPGQDRDFNRVYGELRTFLDNSFKKAKIELSIVKYDRNLTYKMRNKEFTLHDRFLITNNFRFSVGTGFNLFKQNEILNPNDSELDVKFHFYRHNFLKIREKLIDYANYASIAKEVLGSKNNRLLNRCNASFQLVS